MKTISEYLEEDCEKWADHPWIRTRGKEGWEDCTFREAVDAVRSISKSLLKKGLHHKNLMLCSENSREWILLYLGIMGYVGTCVPVDPTWTEYDLEHTMSVIPVSAVFYSRARKDCMEPLKDRYPDTIWFCIEDALPDLIREGEASQALLAGRNDMDQTAMILFTSGTTDLPKAIPLTQRNLFANWDTLYRRTPMTEHDVSYVFLPLHHVYTGVANVLYTIISGMQLCLCPDLSQLIPGLLEVRPTVVCMVPLFLYRLYDAMTDELLEVLRHIRFLYCGGSFTDPAVKEYFIRQGVCLLEAYGTTETSSVIALAVPQDPDLASNGVVFENLEVRILDPDEEGVGEIVVKGESVSRGYLDQNGGCSGFDEDGAYHTGDLGRLSDTGHLYLKGRKKRMILTANGKNIYVDELEELIRKNPQIRAVKVYEQDHHPAAAIVSDLPEEEVRTYMEKINRCLPRYKQIRQICIKPDVPGGRIK